MSAGDVKNTTCCVGLRGMLRWPTQHVVFAFAARCVLQPPWRRCKCLSFAARPEDSYIRLYALGLAGAMLGAAFNDLGLMVLGDAPGIGSWIGFVVIVVFGHVLNLLMACLGAFVHPLRLTFVEYFKNSGYEGLGKLYKPFKK